MKFFTIALLMGFLYSTKAQYGEKIQKDSLQRIVNNPETKNANRIEPLAYLSGIYASQGDSLNAVKFLTQARKLAGREKDSKYLIYVYNQNIANSVDAYPKNIKKLYRIIDSIYSSIAQTSDLEAKALGYRYIGLAKSIADPEYNLDDYFKSLSIAEKLSESFIKNKILYGIYSALVRRNFNKDKYETEKYLQLMMQAAEKTGDKSILCDALSKNLYTIIAHSPNDKNLISQNFEHFENFIAKNGTHISSNSYGLAVNNLRYAYQAIPNTRYKELVDRHIENFKKASGNNLKNQIVLLNIEEMDSYEQKNYAKTIEILHKLIELKNKTGDSSLLLFESYKNLAEVYSETRQYQQAAESWRKSLEAFQESTNAQMEEQRQLAEVRFGVEKHKQQIELKRKQLMIIIILSALVLMILLAVIIMLNRQKKIHKLEKENAKLIARQVVEEKENISKKLITASSELKRKDQLLEKTKSMDKNQLHKAIRFEQKKNKLIANYTELFQQIRPEFYERLQQSAAPNKLSNSDLKYCAYISLRTDNKELANIMDVNYSTVLTKKYRLKKKLHLSVQDNLEEFIVKFTPLR